MLNKYRKAKEKARQKAIKWQEDFCEKVYTYELLAREQAELERIAKRYGLIKEFRENAII